MAEQVDSVRCMVMPLNGGALLIPNAALAEVISYSAPPEELSKEAPWLVGFAAWRGVDVPLVAFERSCGLDEPGSNPRAQVAVLYGVSGDKACPYVGLRLQGIPRSMVVSPDRLTPRSVESAHPFVHAELTISDTDVMLPDLPALEGAIKTVVQQL
jgi:chemosensory pili system protein ChpC